MSKSIRVGATYTTKIGRNSVEVKVTGTNEKGWEVTTASGKVLTIKDAARLTPVHATTPAATPETTEPASTPKRRSRAAADGQPREKKLGLMGAAQKVLAEAEQADLPMSTAKMVEIAMSKGYWKPAKGGKTPSNTLYAMILRDMQKHAGDAKFRRAEEHFGRGRFFLNR